MQIIAGSAKGRRLKSLPGLATRPILARIKKSLFDIIKIRIPESYFLDLYAGTGAVGIEALSRGASCAVFVEKESAAIKIIQENLKICSFESRGQVLQGNVFEIMRNLGQKYDLIFVGPPYKLTVTADTISAIDCHNLLAKDGLIMAQHHFKEPLKMNIDRLVMYREEKYGDTRLSFFKGGI